MNWPATSGAMLSVLVVCVGNICRSPVAERVLAARLPRVRVRSAGLAAVVGAPADRTTAAAAAELGIDLAGHVARQLDAELGKAHSLILALEPGHRAEIFLRFPALSGRVMLLDHWTGGQGIADPYGQPIEAHRHACERIVAAATPWITRLGGPAA